MKKSVAVLLALVLVLALSAPAMAETTISSAYVYEEDSMPKYWLDFTGSIADNLVLHCFFKTDSWYETRYVLDFVSAVPNSHQDTYRIETVWDARGNDVSNWFKTVSLEISEDAVRLYIERNEATLAGGPGSTILTGSYEMIPGNAGVVYETYADGRLQTWLYLNDAYAELHFADGEEWYLETASSGDYSQNVIRITDGTGTEVSFQSVQLTYVQGAIILTLQGAGERSGVYTLEPRTFLQREAGSAEELGRMAQLHYKRISGYYPPEAEVEDHGDGTYTVHLYEIVNDGNNAWHTATSAWYTVDAAGVGTDDIFGTPVDLAS